MLCRRCWTGRCWCVGCSCPFLLFHLHQTGRYDTMPLLPQSCQATRPSQASIRADSAPLTVRPHHRFWPPPTPTIRSTRTGCSPLSLLPKPWHPPNSAGDFHPCQPFCTDRQIFVTPSTLCRITQFWKSPRHYLNQLKRPASSSAALLAAS